MAVVDRDWEDDDSTTGEIDLAFLGRRRSALAALAAELAVMEEGEELSSSRYMVVSPKYDDVL